MQLAKCYATLANNGVCNEVSCIKQVKQGDKVLYKDTAHPQSVFDAKSTYLMTDMLKCATKQGTARALGNLPFQVAAKTGTVGDSEGNSVAVVAGYTTSNTFVFRFGGELPNSVNGATAPCQLADKVLKVICKEKPADFTPPQGVTQRSTVTVRQSTCKTVGKRRKILVRCKQQAHRNTTKRDFPLHFDHRKGGRTNKAGVARSFRGKILENIPCKRRTKTGNLYHKSGKRGILCRTLAGRRIALHYS